MDRLTVWMVKASFLWMVLGFVIGALMLTDRVAPGQWRLWLQPTHGHILFVGWFVQFTIGIAYWLLPRRRNPEKPLGYNQRLAFTAMACLNLGMLARVIGEPMERIDRTLADQAMGFLIASSILQVAAVLIFVRQLWTRVYPKGRLAEWQRIEAEKKKAAAN